MDGLPPHHPQAQNNHSHYPNNTQPVYDGQPQNLAPAGRFTEEWDATQRGSSIIDGHRGTLTSANANANSSSNTANMSSMQRSNSAHSYNAGDDTHLQQGLPSRSNTLKKKNSMRRGGGGSIRRSGSRRSMKAGSVRSLALHSASDPDEAHSVFYCPIPTTGNPTDVLCNRFNSESLSSPREAPADSSP